MGDSISGDFTLTVSFFEKKVNLLFFTSGNFSSTFFSTSLMSLTTGFEKLKRLAGFRGDSYTGFEKLKRLAGLIGTISSTGFFRIFTDGLEESSSSYLSPRLAIEFILGFNVYLRFYGEVITFAAIY